jgi:hopanoid biosynthesis associated RND transporter like protein HpnN
MKRGCEDFLARGLGSWVTLVQRRAGLFLSVVLFFTLGVLYYSVRNFDINTDTNAMISDNLRFRKLEKDFNRAFPQLSDTIVVVVNGDTPELAVSARKRLGERLRTEKSLFKSVSEPGGGSFFEKEGLLYLSENELEDFADNMAAAQPLIGLLSRDTSLRGLFSVVQKTLAPQQDAGGGDGKIASLYEQLGEAFDAAAAQRSSRMSWQELMLGKKGAEQQKRQFIIAQPYLDQGNLSSGEAPLRAVVRAAKELGYTDAGGVKVAVTGDVALASENLTEVRNSMGAATVASVVLVGLILFVGFGRNVRLMAAGLATLLVGLVWTTGFAIAFIGRLNMISITFAVLFIGLGIDYSIQFCLRYKELMDLAGAAQRESIVATATGVGRSLLLSCITTAIGFYAFLPTAYAGVAELGLISGTGMFVSFFANLTVLPALLAVMPVAPKKTPPSGAKGAITAIPYRYPGAITAISLALGIGSALLVPKVYFDYNPLNLYDQKSEAVSAIKDLFSDPAATPWTISVLVKGERETKELAEKLRQLKEVKMVATLFDFVPEAQTQKLGIISDVRLFMPPGLGQVQVMKLSYVQNLNAFRDLEKAVKKALSQPRGVENRQLSTLYRGMQKFQLLLRDRGSGTKAFDALREGVLSNLPALFQNLDRSLQASTIDVSRLPQDLVSLYRSPDGRYRLQVFPAENILDRHALSRFVASVRAVAPDATDAPVSIYESGMAIISSFKEATLYAFIAIVIFLLIELKNVWVTVLILVPLVLVTLLTGAASVLLGIPLNFANVIVVPLLLGVGVHSGIIFVVRYQTEPPPGGNMLMTSNARAALFSSLTTMVSTGSLSFSSHRGISSIGILLTICLGFLIFSTLVLLPALLKLSERRIRDEEFT